MMVSLMPHQRARAKRLTPTLSGSQPGFLSIVMSVLASAFGVQSQQNYQRDFSQGNLVVYLVIGVLFVALFVAALAMLVLFITHYYG